ncbi:MAG: DUF4391 domain-containing protein [Caldilineaceae bacterium]|nr:DUF4391 domain-containing protein [Caldilineaceae bacterium]
MSIIDPVAALMLPDGAIVDRRVAKKLLIEHGARTASDRRHIREGIEEIRWLASLKPTTIGVAEYHDSGREYVEIAVLKLRLRCGARAERLTELVHRAVPYPVVLFSCGEDGLVISLAHVRWSLGEGGKTVLDGNVVATPPLNDQEHETTMAFIENLAVGSQPRATLHSLYQGWIDAVRALRVAGVTGEFQLPASQFEAEERAAALGEFYRLESRIAELNAAASKEKQIARRVDLNLELKRLRSDRDVIRARL